jgi:endonuclease/exonuclease/phosphatase family metal-dependent hydrolase
LRPLLEVTAEGKKGTEFTLFVCHWKSKSGGAEETDYWRDKQENLLSDCIQKNTNQHIIACGDFNRDLSEFNIDFSDNSIYLQGYKTTKVKMKNPWLVTNHKGSYNFNGQWNKIDHFFFSDKVQLLSFGTIKEYTNQEGLPIKYSVRSGSGYSDHLPIMSYVVLQ